MKIIKVILGKLKGDSVDLSNSEKFETKVKEVVITEDEILNGIDFEKIKIKAIEKIESKIADYLSWSFNPDVFLSEEFNEKLNIKIFEALDSSDIQGEFSKSVKNIMAKKFGEYLDISVSRSRD